MKAKLVFILCIFCTQFTSAQVNLNSDGIFQFVDTLPIDSNFLIAPGQVSKNGQSFYLGLTSGAIAMDEDPVSALYKIDITSDASITNGPQRINLPNPENLFQFYQCSLSEDENTMLFVINNGGGWLQNQLAISIKDAEGNFTSIRILDELNDSLKSDSYPWLSADAHRLYFTRDFNMMYAERKSVQDKFSAPVEVDFIGDVQLEIISAWLTPDELTMFMIANSTIYKSSRKSKNDSFGFPQLFTDEFSEFYFIAGLSFTPDGKTMYIYYYDEYADYILQYQLKKGKI